jgi:hypothetical protein
MIKRVNKGSKEVEITQFLSLEPLKSNPRNHCVPLLDLLPDPTDSEKCFMVMLSLRPHNDHEFETVGQVIEFGYQLLEVRCEVSLHCAFPHLHQLQREYVLCMNTTSHIGKFLKPGLHSF